jgi:hypothetical protein
MEPVSVGVGAAVATLLAKAWDRAGDHAVEAAEGVVGRLVARLRERFGGRGDEDAAAALTTLESAPDSARSLQAVAAAIERQVEQDPAWGDELRALVAEAEESGFVVGSASQTAWGSGNAQVQNTQGSSISINRHGTERPS